MNKQPSLASAGAMPQIPSFLSRLPISNLLFSGGVIFLLLYGWVNRDDSYLSATDGLGYALGIIGGSAMLLLLIYPLRKHVRLMRSWGPVSLWFRVHMLLGILGPVLVLFHANFSLGSMNSNLALFCMLLVASSGVVGRYFYTKIHHGLYGRKATLKELRSEMEITKGNLYSHFTLSPRILKRLKRFEHYLLAERNFAHGLASMPLMYANTLWTLYYIRRQLHKELKKQAGKRVWDKSMYRQFAQDANSMLSEYINCVRKTGELAVYARLFALWHIFHLPLFITLILSGIVHVVAVHMY